MIEKEKFDPRNLTAEEAQKSAEGRVGGQADDLERVTEIMSKAGSQKQRLAKLMFDLMAELKPRNLSKAEINAELRNMLERETKEKTAP